MKGLLDAPGGDADALGRSASDGPGRSPDNTKDTTVARRATENCNTNGNSIDGHLGAQIAVAEMPIAFSQLQSPLASPLSVVPFVRTSCPSCTPDSRL